jgi:uncharacterized protein (DUF433 family)
MKNRPARFVVGLFFSAEETAALAAARQPFSFRGRGFLLSCGVSKRRGGSAMTGGKNLIEVDPEKLGGTPVFYGTRVPVQNLFDCLETGESLGQFLEQFPSVTREQVLAVLEESKERLLVGYESAA